MRLDKLTTPRKKGLPIKTICSTIALFLVTHINAQDNSPYSRYGLGTMVPSSNVINRGMGGVNAAYSDMLSINYNNPASYSSFKMYLEERSKNPVSGRVILDAGVNFQSRTLREPNQPQKFTSSDVYFSYLQLGIPLRNNWGLSFGLRPLSRIYYKINSRDQLINPITGQPIDSAITEFTGDGGLFLPSIGTGFAIKNFSIGANVGYLFGKKEYSTKRSLYNDSTDYNSSNHTTNTSFGDLFFNAGAQYKIKLNPKSTLSLGVSGNIQQDIGASQDIIRETFVRDANGSDFRVDSVYEQKGQNGTITYPASYTAGFVFERQIGNTGSFLAGADFVQTKWNDYRYFGQVDSVQDNWQLRVGGHYRPNAKTGSGYFNNVTYRAGFFAGPDYIHVQNSLPQFGLSFGMGLPLANYNRLSPGQYTIVNVALEYEKRGNNDNLLKENLFRISLGLNFSDLWFNKRKYD